MNELTVEKDGRNVTATKVVVSNYWHNPGITVRVIHHQETAPAGSCHVEISMEDLIQALMAELDPKQWTEPIAERLPHPILAFTRQRHAAALESALAASKSEIETEIRAAINNALERAKEASAEVFK